MVVLRWMFTCCLSAAGSCLSGAASGQALPQIKIACEPLDVERTAQVEARVRARLLTAQVPDPEVAITCTGAQAKVDIKAGTAAAQVEVSAERLGLEERLLDGVDQALRELAEPGSGGAAVLPEVASPPQPSPPPAVEWLPQPSLRQREAATNGRPSPAPSVRARALLELAGLALVEHWSAGEAFGGMADVSYGGATWRGSLAVGGARLNQSNPAFRSTEAHVQTALVWGPPWAWGVRGSCGVGASLLAIAPRDDFAPRNRTTAFAAFAEVALSRPFWFSTHWAIAPRLAARLMAARLRVTVNAEEALALSGVAPSVGIALVYRVE